MEWYLRCIDCRSQISVDGVDWSHANRIHMVCEIFIHTQHVREDRQAYSSDRYSYNSLESIQEQIVLK